MTSTDTLTKLHTALIDTRRGYEKAAKDAETTELKSLFDEMVALRGRHHDDVHRLLVERGETPDDGGSLMGTVHETVVGARSAITGIDDNALGAFVRGEDNVLELYAAAERDAAGPAERERLEAQKTEVMALVDRMKRLQASSS